MQSTSGPQAQLEPTGFESHILSGECRTAALPLAQGAAARCGIWECTPGSWKSTWASWEIFTVLSGRGPSPTGRGMCTFSDRARSFTSLKDPLACGTSARRSARATWPHRSRRDQPASNSRCRYFEGGWQLRFAVRTQAPACPGRAISEVVEEARPKSCARIARRYGRWDGLQPQSTSGSYEFRSAIAKCALSRMSACPRLTFTESSVGQQHRSAAAKLRPNLRSQRKTPA